MKTFIVEKREVWTQQVEVEAKDEKDAIQKVYRGLGMEVDNTLTYSHDLDENTWTVADKDLVT